VHKYPEIRQCHTVRPARHEVLFGLMSENDIRHLLQAASPARRAFLAPDLTWRGCNDLVVRRSD
jgi:hypothetical protein